MPTEPLSLIELFNTLTSPTTVGNKAVYNVVSISPYPRHRLGKDARGAPTLLIRLDTRSGSSTTPPIRLQHLYIAHDLDCEIHRDGQAESGRFTVVSCVDADEPMETYFLRVIQALLPSLGENPNPRTINQAMDHLVELFQALKNPPRKTAQGLWAELLVIAEARNAKALVDTWHLMPDDLYDFNSGAQRLEVKSTSGQTRRHHFSLAQLQPPSNTTLIIASVFANRTGAGTTVTNLVEEIVSRMTSNPDSVLRLYKVVALTLGDTWRQATFEAFDREAARHSLAFFDASVVPIIDPQLPPGVSDVHFTSDLTGKTPLAMAQFQAYGGFISMLRQSTEISKGG